MKSLFKAIIAIVLICAMMTSCSFVKTGNDAVNGLLNSASEANEVEIESERTFAVGDFGVKVSVGDDWKKTDATNFDLQLASDKFGANLSVFIFYKVDLSNGDTAETTFNDQNDTLFNGRDNVIIVSETEVETVGTKTVYSKTTSAELKGTKNYYRTYMIDDSESKVIAWVLVNSMPSDMEKNQGYFDGIIDKISFK